MFIACYGKTDFNKGIKSLDRLFFEIGFGFKPHFIYTRLQYKILLQEIWYTSVSVSGSEGQLLPAFFLLLI